MNRTLLCVMVSFAMSLIAAFGTAQQFELGDVIVSGGVTVPNPPNFPDYDPKLLWFDRNGQFKGQLAELFLNEHFYRVAFSPSGALHAASSRGILTVTPGGQVSAGGFGNDTYLSLSFAVDGTLVAGGGGVLALFASSGARFKYYLLPQTDTAASIDLASDQCTAYYLYINVFGRFDVCQGALLPRVPYAGGGADFRLLRDAGGVQRAAAAIEAHFSAYGAHKLALELGGLRE